VAFRKLKPISNTLGSNATRVLGHIKLTLDPEPKLAAGPDNILSNAWVEWHIRQTGVPRKIAINRGYNLLDHEGDTLPSSKPFEVDEGLAILGTHRMADYFYHARLHLKAQFTHFSPMLGNRI